MRRFSVSVLVVACGIVSTAAMQDLKSEIAQVLARQAQAAATCDAEGYGRYVAEDALFTSPEGSVVSGSMRRTDIASPACQKRARQEYADLLVRQYRDVAVVTATRKGPGDAERVTRVLVRNSDGWKIVASQGSPMNEAAAKMTAPAVVAGPVDAAAGAGAEKMLRAALDEVLASNASGDAARSARTSGDDYVRISALGAIEPKSVVTESMARNNATPTPRQPTVAEELQIRMYGPVAVTSSLERVTNPTATDKRPNRALRVFVHRGGRWVLVATHVRKVGAAPATQGAH